VPPTVGIYFEADLQTLNYQFIDFVFKGKKVLQNSETAFEYIPC
jgi:hypothetical protein